MLKRIIFLSLILSVFSFRVEATTKLFTGFETGGVTNTGTGECPSIRGTVSTSTTTVKSGNYSLKLVGDNNENACGVSICTDTTVPNCSPATGFTTFYTKFDFQYDVLPTSDVRIMEVAYGTGSASEHNGSCGVRSVANSSLIYGFADGGSTTSGSTAIVLGTWYRMEMLTDTTGANTVVKCYLNGNLEVTISDGTATTTPARLNIRNIAQASPSASLYVDNMVIDNAALPGNILIIARQGTAGTSTYNNWTLNSCATIDVCWNETPFGATMNATVTTNVAQTVLTGSFGTTQTGHGTDFIASTDTINFCMPVLVGKAGASAGLTSRIRINSVDTDVILTASASDVIRVTYASLSVPSLTNLNASEMGALRRGSGGNAAQVEDEWIECGYTPSTVSHHGALVLSY